MNPPNKGMQLDLRKRYALAPATDAGLHGLPLLSSKGVVDSRH